MDQEAFIRAYNESRNGTDHFYFNRLYPKFYYSDGVKECAEAGCYWLIALLGTELPEHFKKRQEYSCCIRVIVDAKNSCRVVGTFYDDDISPYFKEIQYTDLPEGEWVFYVTDEGAEFGYRCILLSEY